MGFAALNPSYKTLQSHLQLRGAGVRGEQRGQPCGIAARHAALRPDAVDAGVTARGREARSIALRIVVMDQAEIEAGRRRQLQRRERREIAVVGSPLRHRQMEELDRALHAGQNRVGDLDHDAGILGLHHVLVRGAAVAEVIAEIDAIRHRVADPSQHVDGLGAEVGRTFVVVAFPGQHLLAHVPLDRDPVVGNRLRDSLHLADEMLRQRRQQFRPIRRHHVVVGRRNRCRDTDLELDVLRDDTRALHALEQPPRGNRHVGIAGLESRRIGRRAGLDAQARDLAHDLAVPLHELERRHVFGQLDRWVFREHVLQKPDPGLADTGFAVGQPDEVSAHRIRQGPKHGFGIRQRNTTDEMNNGFPALILGVPSVVGVHGEVPPFVFWSHHTLTHGSACRHRRDKPPSPKNVLSCNAAKISVDAGNLWSDPGRSL